jgi:hypothetical protein
MDPALHAALDAFDRDAVRGEVVVRAERAIPLDDVIELFHRLDPSFDPFVAQRPNLDALERLELAAELDGMLGESPWGLAVNAVADAYVVADYPERAFELRLRALARTPRWDGVLAAYQLAQVGRDLRALGRGADAELLDQRAAQLDPTAGPWPGRDSASAGPGLPRLDELAPLDDQGLVDLLLADEYASVLGDDPASPRRLALACVRRGEAGMGRLPLYVTRKWEPYVSGVAQALRLGPGGDPQVTSQSASGCEMRRALVGADAGNNGRLLKAIEALPAGAEAVKLSRKKAANAFNGNENTRVRFYAERAASGDWATVRQGLLSWERKCRLFVGGLLAMHGEPLGTAYVERAAALAAELSHDGYEVGDDFALPRKVLARRGGDLSATWWGL